MADETIAREPVIAWLVVGSPTAPAAGQAVHLLPLTPGEYEVADLPAAVAAGERILWVVPAAPGTLAVYGWIDAASVVGGGEWELLGYEFPHRAGAVPDWAAEREVRRRAARGQLAPKPLADPARR